MTVSHNELNELHELNSWIQKGYVKMNPFPGAASREVLHYAYPTYPTLKDGLYNTS